MDTMYIGKQARDNHYENTSKDTSDRSASERRDVSRSSSSLVDSNLRWRGRDKQLPQDPTV
jgi:hypothetical protein